MFDITIIAIGKIKDKSCREAFDGYLQRLAPYARIKIEELKAEPFKRDSDKPKAKKIEGEKIRQLLNKRRHAEIALLDERGRQFDSLEFSNFINTRQRPIIFIIGGALGFDENLLRLPLTKISLSPLTFPHELARVILAEQLYRAAAIAGGKDYHY